MADTQTRTRPLVAPPLSEVKPGEDAPAEADSSVSVDEPIHKEKGTRFVSDVVEDVVAAWSKSKNFTVGDIHNKVLESKHQLTTKGRGAVQMKLLDMNKAGKIERVSRGRYIKVSPKPSASKKTETPAPHVEIAEDEITPEDLADLMGPEAVSVEDMNSAFDALATLCRLQDTRHPEYWHNFGAMCVTFERMLDALVDDDG